MSEIEKPRISVVVMGHHDCGKSTTLGHLMRQCGGVDDSTLKRLEQEAKSVGKSSSLKYAWLVDMVKAERERGVTIDVSLHKIETNHFTFTFIDTPGHRDFCKNMIAGTVQADVALLLVDATQGSFELSMSKEVGQTREHALLTYALGVKQMIVGVNKMDDPTVQYNEARFHEITNEMTAYLRKVGYKPMKIPMVPMSGQRGDNLVENCTAKMPWYHGPTLLEALDNCTVPKRPTDKPLRLPLQDVYKVGGVGTVPVGRIEAGLLRPNTRIQFAPSGLIAECRSLERHHESVEEAGPGDNVGFHAKLVSHKDLHRGEVASSADDDPALPVESFVAQVIIMNHPGKISNGYCPVLHCHTAHVACAFEEITEKLERKTGDLVDTNPGFVEQGDACTVRIKPTKPLCVEAFADYPPLGRFVLRDRKTVVAVGIIKSVNKIGEM